MLPPFIIDQIRRREDEERRRRDGPALELPLPAPRSQPERRSSDEEPKRGVIIIDLG
jgi:hypothetical protein